MKTLTLDQWLKIPAYMRKANIYYAFHCQEIEIEIDTTEKTDYYQRHNYTIVNPDFSSSDYYVEKRESRTTIIPVVTRKAETKQIKKTYKGNDNIDVPTFLLKQMKRGN